MLSQLFSRLHQHGYDISEAALRFGSIAICRLNYRAGTERCTLPDVENLFVLEMTGPRSPFGRDIDGHPTRPIAAETHRLMPMLCFC